MAIHEIDIFKNIPITGLSPKVMDCIAESALVCLDNQGHNTGVTLTVKGDINNNIALSWTIEITNQLKDTWNDLQDATENGATYLAILIVHCFTPLKVIKRSQKGTGFDYWLGEKEDEIHPFQNKARLEISGILQENKKGRINSRVNNKLVQIKQSDNLNLPAYIVIVEFSHPQSKVVIK